MLAYIINFSINNKLIILLFTISIFGFGVYSLTQIPIGAVPDITNNQVQVITTSRNLSTQDIEQFITYPIELEMANLPGVKEIRSVSKFGLSVVTIVFEDNMGTYLPRQLIAEKIKSASQKIPEGFGSPEMGPVTTGLGEIYQYVLDVDPKYKSQYSTMELRTIQDWLVKRQLSGIPGVVEVNTWGGFLKQYEVSINPQKLRSLNLTISEVFTALNKNNSVAGGGYIEKANEAYFIRAEGLIGTISDIEDIMVENRNGLPIYVKDVATVGFGYATRFGAITGNGEGEKVLGQVMMLKDANSKAVIDAVKQRVNEIQSSLPKGISINGFLERSELIDKTTWTVSENLILGCLIVVFVVVLLLGNLRSGLVVASIIPLSLLFAISLMYIFGVDANLMSLGAIDFGIIIDGAVIIVEFIAFQITAKSKEIWSFPAEKRQSFINDVTYRSATKMMRSAVFGQLIIIIVFIPILSLVNVEGKMFRPMALTFSFALIGAMILCFTYIPVVSSIFLRPAKTVKKTLSSKLMALLEKWYTPTLSLALQYKKGVLTAAAILLLAVAWLFSTMGGEFVPTLDEGDFVIQPVLKTGTSLSETVKTTTKIEKILMTFPEVEQVVTRIGAAEIPTDPMSMEESDVIITLKPRNEWTSTNSKDELADLFKKALTDEIPGIDYEFTQPIEMRFNELITGVRADLAIKIFGEDLVVLSHKAEEIEKLIEAVEGAADITVEKVDGLPQMSVKYNRSKIAKYNLNIEDVNEVVSMAFAGLTAGSVFEGEKRFDLVIRYEERFRKDIQNIENAYVPLPSGEQIPLQELAEISYTKGPAKISRDDTKRRIVVGVNVRNRDLESVVEDVQNLIQNNIDLPVGYNITYGGQFENLRSARQRLSVAVPIALILIFILLHFAFGSVKEALMVYSAIPLSAIGGVLLLWLRDMPFSISAGVGFIALFGIAVLNGIVLIEHFKELKAEGIADIRERILLGTKQRLRPVLLTASAAAMGFLPMAISTSAGAEVQRPLATVVVGGLITATLLTLIVLPVLYYIFDSDWSKLKTKPKALILILLALLPTIGNGQNKEISLDAAIEIAVSNNAGLKASSLHVEKSNQLTKGGYNFEKTGIYYNYDQNNIAQNNSPLKVWGIQQNFLFPSVYGKQRKIYKSQSRMQQQLHEIEKQLLLKEVSKAYYEVMYRQQLYTNYLFLDSIYTNFAKAAQRKYELGETNYLEKLTADSKRADLKVRLGQVQEDVELAYQNLYKWLQCEYEITIPQSSYEQLVIVPPDTSDYAGLRYYKEAQQSADLSYRLEKNRLLPDIQLEYFQGSNDLVNADTYQGFQIGLAVPLFFGNQKSLIKSSQIEREIIRQQTQNYRIDMLTRYRQLQSELNKYQKALSSYQEAGAQLSEEIINTANKSFQHGEIDFFQYTQSLDNAISIEMSYLENLNRYNQTALEINYLTN